MAELPTVSVVMPTYNRRARLPEVLAPLLADPEAHELVVVVDGCRDGSYELLCELARHDGRLRPRLIENRGENDARQAGVEAATGDVVLVLDDDVRARPGLVAGHARRHAGATGLVVMGYMPTPDPPRDFITRLYGREYESICRLYERAPERILHHLWAGNLSLRREDYLRAIAGRDAPPLEYHADRELGLRWLEAGLRGAFDRSLRADHLHESHLDRFAREARAQGAGTIALHRLHGELLGPPPGFAGGLPAPLRRWLRLCRRPRVAAASARVLLELTRAAGLIRADRAQELSGRLLRRVEQQRGAMGAR